MQIVITYGEGEEAAASVLLGKVAIELAGNAKEITAEESRAPHFKSFVMKTAPVTLLRSRRTHRTRHYPLTGRGDIE